MMGFKLVAIISGIAAFGFLENLLPFFQFKNSLLNRTFPNLLLGLFNFIIISLILKFPHTHFDLIQSPLLAFLVLDVYMYWWHRLMHTLPIAWQFHQVHHTDRSMNTSTAYRFHTVEIILSNLPKLFLIWLLGITPNHLLIYEILFALELLFQHSNWYVPLKIDKYLSYLIVTPNYHRAHHSQLVGETNTNYASILSLWDRLFKSYYYPQVPSLIQLGLDGVKEELNVLDLLILPFKR
jgi:sterol desaturase/sphingolipid hydroxylase (fatty acid hydroxylase superfamily)